MERENERKEDNIKSLVLGRIQTHNILIMRLVLYRYATATDQPRMIFLGASFQTAELSIHCS